MSERTRKVQMGSKTDDSTKDDRAVTESWVESWAEFVEKHRSWWDRVNREDPVYCLPTEIIECLAEGTLASNSPHRASKPLIPAEDAKAEHEFLKVCRRVHGGAIGFWNTCAISYPTLNERNNRDLSDDSEAFESETNVLPANLKASLKRDLGGSPK